MFSYELECEDKIYIKIIVLDMAYNFAVEKFFIWSSLLPKI